MGTEPISKDGSTGVVTKTVEIEMLMLEQEQLKYGSAGVGAETVEMKVQVLEQKQKRWKRPV